VSAGFRYRDEVYWGTNGAVELSLETLRDLALDRHAGDPELARFFGDERESFFSGAVVELGPVTANAELRAKTARLFARAMAVLGAPEGGLTDYGRDWVASELARLERALLAG